MKTKGTVTKATNRDGRFGIEIGEGNWYNGFGINPCNTGDVVEFEYAENPGNTPGIVFKNVKPEDVKILESAPEVPSGQELGLKKKLITECTLKAVDIITSTQETNKLDLNPTAIKETAKLFYRISTEIFDEDN